jgi:DNA-binding transcriptional regulator YiaG
MAAIEHEWAKRIRAAAAYAGMEQKELAAALGMSVSTLGRHLKANKRPHEIRALSQTVAELTGLPNEFFTVDFSRLAELGDVTVIGLGEVGSDVVQLVEQLQKASQQQEERMRELEQRLAEQGQSLEEMAINEGRGLTQDAVDQVGDDARAEPAADDTRDEGRASQEAAQARAGGRTASE